MKLDDPLAPLCSAWARLEFLRTPLRQSTTVSHRPLEQRPFTLNQAQALSFRGREAEPGTHEHRRLRTVAPRLRRRV